MKISVCISALLLVITLEAGAQSNSAPVRLALMSDGAAATTAADLLTAELSKKQHVQLLERAQIEKVYREQGLSAANRDYLKLGQILGADGLLLLETAKEGTNQFLRVRLVAVKPGVIIEAVRVQWPVAEPVQWAKWIGNRFDPLFLKLGVQAKDAIPISVVNLRSAVRSPDAQEAERQLTTLAIERLTRQRELFVLERRQMESLAAEKELNLDESTFWNGSYLLDGVIDRDGYSKDTVTINARLTPPKGGTPLLIAVSGSRANLSEVINRLAAQVTVDLKLSSRAAPWNAADEAEQYFDEAKWALKWRMFKEAQAACDSSWALGKRTKEVAALRIGSRIYDRPTIVVPQAAHLVPCTRALELFSNDTSWIKTNSFPPDWYELGYNALKRAGEILGSFNEMVEARRGNEAQLAELRSLARRVVVILETNIPSVSEDLQSSLNSLKWEKGGLWFEQPEEVLPMYRKIMEAHFHPQVLPKVAAWSWNDRKRIPRLMKQFVDDLCTSTDSDVQLQALYLSLIRTPLDVEGSLQMREKELVEAMWEQRQKILSSETNTLLLENVENIIISKHRLDRDDQHNIEPFGDFIHRLRKEYLLKVPATNYFVFYQLFSLHDNSYRPADAAELVPLIEDFKRKWLVTWGVESVTGRLRKIAGTTVNTLETPSPKTAIAAEDPVGAQFTNWKLEPSLQDGFQPAGEPILRRGKLWVPISRSVPNQHFSYVAIDPQTGRCELDIPLPEKLGTPGSIEVTDESLFATVHNGLARYRFKQKSWETIPVPLGTGGRIYLLNGRLYLATQDSLLEVNADSAEVRILVSSRRQPAANEMDSLWTSRPRIVYPRSDGKLGVLVESNLFTLTPANGAWRKILYLPIKRPETIPFFSPDGIQLLLIGSSLPHCVLTIENNSTESHTLLTHYHQTQSDPDLEKLAPPPRWDWPQPYHLNFCSILSEGENLWLLNPRRGIDYRSGFTDDRHATLLRFKPGSRQALCIPIRFEKAGQPFDPFDASHVTFYLARGGPVAIARNIFWLDVPQGFIFGIPGSAGHWFVPKETLETRLPDLQKSSRNNAETNAQAESLPKTQSGVNQTAVKTDSARF